MFVKFGYVWWFIAEKQDQLSTILLTLNTEVIHNFLTLLMSMISTQLHYQRDLFNLCCHGSVTCSVTGSSDKLSYCLPFMSSCFITGLNVDFFFLTACYYLRNCCIILSLLSISVQTIVFGTKILFNCTVVYTCIMEFFNSSEYELNILNIFKDFKCMLLMMYV